MINPFKHIWAFVAHYTNATGDAVSKYYAPVIKAILVACWIVYAAITTVAVLTIWIMPMEKEPFSVWVALCGYLPLVLIWIGIKYHQFYVEQEKEGARIARKLMSIDDVDTQYDARNTGGMCATGNGRGRP